MVWVYHSIEEIRQNDPNRQAARLDLVQGRFTDAEITEALEQNPLIYIIALFARGGNWTQLLQHLTTRQNLKSVLLLNTPA